MIRSFLTLPEEGRLAALTQDAPRMPWDAFLGQFRPEAGEHIGIIGTTGAGKTVLQKNILPLFPFTAVFATKPQDISMDRLIETGGYIKLYQWVRLNPRDYPRRVIWPKTRSAKRTKALQRQIFEDAFEKIFQEAGQPKESPVGWAVGIDELWWVTNELGLREEVKWFLYQGRSLGHTMILATQKPFYVPSEVYDQSTHLFFFQNNEGRAIQRLGEINARDAALVRYIVPRLDRHQVLYVNTVTQQMIRTRVPAQLAGVSNG